MPELPEVETVRRGLASSISGYTVSHVEIFDERSLKKNVGSPSSFSMELEGSKLSTFERRGKFLWMPIGEDRCLVTHLGMSGQILVRMPGYPEEKCERLRITVSKGKNRFQVRFIDQRLFGGMYLDELVNQGLFGTVPQSAKHIALDPLDKNFDLEGVALKISKSTAGIKSSLLNQEILSGVGNIYADETLWLTKMHYLTSGNSISRQQIRKVIKTAREVLSSALALGGTSFDQQYKHVNGGSGQFSKSLNVYGRQGLNCKRCQANIVKEAWSNRSSHFCPRCQRATTTGNLSTER